MHFAIDRCRRGDDTTAGIDVKQAIGIAGQAVGNGVVGRVQVECVGGNAHRRAYADILSDFIRGCIAIGGYSDVEFIHVVDGDRKRLIIGQSVNICDSDRDRVCSRVLAIQLRSIRDENIAGNAIIEKRPDAVSVRL